MAPELLKLCDVLAELFPDDSASRLVVAGAGLDAAMISFDSRAAVNWFNIIGYANNCERVLSVADFALEKYPGNKELREARESIVRQRAAKPAPPAVRPPGGRAGAGVLPHDRIRGLQAAVIGCGLSSHEQQDALLVGLPAGYVAGLPTVNEPAARLLRQLDRLNQDKLRDGTVPLEVWLANAAHQAADHPEAEVFEGALAELRMSR